MSEGLHSGGGDGRRLSLSFASPEDFAAEYRRNVAKGGAFVPTNVGFELRETVRVCLELAWRSETVELEAEIVHVVPRELAGAGATPGVAVQFLLPASQLRLRLSRIAEEAAVQAASPDPAQRFFEDVDLGDPTDPEPSDTTLAADLSPETTDPSARALETSEGLYTKVGQRTARAPREAARVKLLLRTPDGEREGYTRDISRSGVLVSADGSDVPVGTRVGLRFTHPFSAEAFDIEGVVARHVEGEGTVAALGIHFEVARDREAEVALFLHDLSSADHARRLGGIRGAVPPNGIADLLQGLGKSAPSGTLTIQRRGEEACVAFEDGGLRYSRLGALAGVKALARILSWRDGTFEFHAHVDPLADEGPPAPLEGEILKAAIAMDEAMRSQAAPDPAAQVRLRNPPGAGEREALGNVELAVLDLAEASFTVRRILDVIPDSDARIQNALLTLHERGFIHFS
jgi:Tfp pilus assembly protein PilZ